MLSPSPLSSLRNPTGRVGLSLPLLVPMSVHTHTQTLTISSPDQCLFSQSQGVPFIEATSMLLCLPLSSTFAKVGPGGAPNHIDGGGGEESSFDCQFLHVSP